MSKFNLGTKPWDISMKSTHIAILILTTVVCVSCKFFTTSIESSKVKYFDVLGDSGLLQSKILKKTLTVCLTYEESRASYDEKKHPTDESSGSATENPAPPAAPAKTYIPYKMLGEQIKKAVLLWVAPLRSLTPNRTLISDVKIITEGCKLDHLENTEISDITVTFLDQPSVSSSQDGVAGVYQSIHEIGVESPPGYILFGNLLTFSTILHEFGHAFGLNDTYDVGTGGDCKFGQPDSLMCLQKTDLVALQPDDINEVRYKFCSFHKAGFPACASFDSLQPGPVTRQDGRAFAAKLGVTVEDFTMTYYEYVVASTEEPSFEDDPRAAIAWSPDYSIYSTDNTKLQEIIRLNPGKVVYLKSWSTTIAGAKVVRVNQDSQAESAGLKAGQLVTKVGTQEISEANNFYEILRFLHSKSVTIDLLGIPAIDSGFTKVKSEDSEKRVSVFRSAERKSVTLDLP